MASAQLLNEAGDQNPPGTIVIFTGVIANIPQGWLLCDGTSGTPDLRDRFCREVPVATNPGTTGGLATVTLTTGNMSSHLHSGVGSSHNHNVPVSDVTSGSVKMVLGGNGADVAPSFADVEQTKAADPIQFEGGDGAHNNMPTFFEVLFIQKE